MTVIHFNMLIMLSILLVKRRPSVGIENEFSFFFAIYVQRRATSYA